MKTIELTVYSISELSDEAKEKAYKKWYSSEVEGGNPWSSDNLSSLKEFYKIFPIHQYGNQWTDFRFGAQESGFYYTDIEEMSGQRLANYIWNNYKTELYKGKYYSTPMKKCEVSKEHPAGLTYKSRHSKIILEHSCVMTGYYMDDEILDPIYKFLDNPTDDITFKDLLEDCTASWTIACEQDNEGRLSMESFVEQAENNEYKYTEDGDLFEE